jgi:hypothetical protein
VAHGEPALRRGAEVARVPEVAGEGRGLRLAADRGARRQGGEGPGDDAAGGAATGTWSCRMRSRASTRGRPASGAGSSSFRRTSFRSTRGPARSGGTTCTRTS